MSKSETSIDVMVNEKIMPSTPALGRNLGTSQGNDSNKNQSVVNFQAQRPSYVSEESEQKIIDRLPSTTRETQMSPIMTTLAERKKAAREARDKLRKKYSTLKKKADDIYEVMHWNIPEYKAKLLNAQWLQLMKTIHPIREEMDAAQHYYEHLQKQREPRPKKNPKMTNPETHND